jgi:hypothetical protein
LIFICTFYLSPIVAGVDFFGNQLTILDFLPTDADLTQCVTLTILDDDVFESDETISLFLSQPAAPETSATVIITDNDG